MNFFYTNDFILTSIITIIQYMLNKFINTLLDKY